MNHWTSPHLDDFVVSIRTDEQLKKAIFILKGKFLSNTEALIHADLHTGSIMVTPDSTVVIDPEFAFYGPMGFDTGLLLANLLFAYFSQPGHLNGEDYADWILLTTITVFNSFRTKFENLWTESTSSGQIIGELHRASFPATESEQSQIRASYLNRIWRDTIGFAGAEMIRRIVGIAHVADLETIVDPIQRSACEKRVLVLARRLMIASTDGNDNSLDTPSQVAQAAKAVFVAPEPTTWP